VRVRRLEPHQDAGPSDPRQSVTRFPSVWARIGHPASAFRNSSSWLPSLELLALVVERASGPAGEEDPPGSRYVANSTPLGRL
jgi:hypothetical protein